MQEKIDTSVFGLLLFVSRNCFSFHLIKNVSSTPLTIHVIDMLGFYKADTYKKSSLIFTE